MHHSVLCENGTPLCYLSHCAFTHSSFKKFWNSLVSFIWIANVNKEMYIDILCCLRDVMKRKHPKNWRTNSWFLLHGNAPAHQSVSVQISSQRTKWNVTDMIFNYFCHQCNWHFESTLLSSRWSGFPWLKSAMKWRCFCDATDIMKNVTKELKRLSQNGLQECIQHLYSHWWKCLIPQRGCFEGNLA